MADIQLLKELRYALAALPIARQNLKNAQDNLSYAQSSVDSSKKFIANPKRTVCDKYTSMVKSEFEKDAREADRIATEKARKEERLKDSQSTVAARIIVVITTLIVFAITAVITFYVAEWSWNTSLDILINKYESTYKEAVGVHLLGLAVALFISAGVVHLISNKSDWDGWGIFCGGFLVVGVISLITCFPYYFADVSGFWEIFGQAFGLILALFISFSSTWRVLAFVISLTLTILATVGTFRLYFKIKGEPKYPEDFYEHIVKKDAMRALDYNLLYKSDIYKEAQMLDAEYGCELDAIKIQEHRDNITYQTKLIGAYQTEINGYQATVKKCNSIIQNATFLNPSYRNIKCIDTIIYYIEYNRADTIKEAINEYIRDQQYLGIMNKLDEIQKNQLRATMAAVSTITKRLDSVQNSISNGLASIRRSVEEQTGAIEAESKKMREQTENMARIAQKNADKRAAQFDSRIGNLISAVNNNHQDMKGFFKNF